MNILKKIGLGIILTTLLLIGVKSVSARENVTNWYVKDFKTEITVNKDSSLDITEKILADCGYATDKHGIFRILPKQYKTMDGNFTYPIELISITDEKGNKLKYSVINDVETVTYKIGDAKVFVQGENFYEIKYRIKNAIRTERSAYDEFYWNVLGTYWDMDIDNFTAQINFPVEINKDNTQINYTTGTLGSKDSDLATYKWVSANSLEFVGTRTISAGRGVTVSVTFPKSIMTPYQSTFKDQYGYSIIGLIFQLILFLIFPIFTFITCYKFWKKNGQDPRLNRTIVPEFEIPENLSPLEMGGILKKGGLHGNALTATIIHLGVLGYLKIEAIEEKILFISNTDYNLIRTDKVQTDDVYKNEMFVLEKIFKSQKEIKLSELKNSFYQNISKISSELLEDFVKRDLIGKIGNQYRIFMIVGGIALQLISPILSGLSIFMSYGLSAAGWIVLFFGIFMDKLTLKGAELNLRVKGFKLYMDTAEKYRSRFQEQEGIMEKLLPYAILFGITKQWLKKMKDIYGEEYFSTYHPAFMAGAIGATNFDSFLSTVDSLSAGIAANVSPSSSGAGGGGSSGGGGGGGGGGGW